MNLLRNDEIDIDKWNHLLNGSAFASPFSSPDFYSFINAIPNIKSEVFAIEDNNEMKALILVVILKETGIKSFFSRRGIIYGGPLIDNCAPETVEFLLKNISILLKGSIIYLESRNYFDFGVFEQSFSKQGWLPVPYLNFQISTKFKTSDEILSEMKYNRRREIKMSLSNGAEYREANNEDEVKAVYRILKDLYATRVKLPLPDFSFFASFLKSEISKVFIITFEGRIIAGCFCLFLPGRNIYTLYYCGLRNIGKKVFPTSLAIFSAIRFATDHNIPILDMMGAGQPDEEYGVRDFKSQFGGTLIEQKRYMKVLNPFLYKIGKLGLRVMSKFN